MRAVKSVTPTFERPRSSSLGSGPVPLHNYHTRKSSTGASPRVSPGRRPGISPTPGEENGIAIRLSEPSSAAPVVPKKNWTTSDNPRATPVLSRTKSRSAINTESFITPHNAVSSEGDSHIASPMWMRKRGDAANSEAPHMHPSEDIPPSPQSVSPTKSQDGCSNTTQDEPEQTTET